MNYFDVAKLREQAERDIRNADKAVQDAARIISGRLKSSSVSRHVLCELKRELSCFNIKTQEWKQ